MYKTEQLTSVATEESDNTLLHGGKRQTNESSSTRHPLLYTVDQIPPWYLSILLGFQHYMTALGGNIAVPTLVGSVVCMAGDTVGLSELIGTVFFVCGLTTVLQSTFGVRLPILQGSTLAFFAPAVALMNLPKYVCPYTAVAGGTVNLTSLPDIGSPDHKLMWMERLRAVQGSILVSSLFQIFIGFSGLIGLALKFIGPLTIAPTVGLIGLSLTAEGAELASQQWWIAILTMVLITVFSQIMTNVRLPWFSYTRKGGFRKTGFRFFSLFPVLLAMGISWSLCAILTTAGVLPEDKDAVGYAARTDTTFKDIQRAAWFRFPYPGQWGLPTVSVAGVVGMLAGVFASMIESIGDYYACAKLSGAPPPPAHAVNRGIGMEGIGCFLAGLWGSGNGTTSYSENIAAIAITKVGSRRVIQVGGCLMMVFGCLGKFVVVFATIPAPVMGGMLMVMVGIVSAVGLSNLQYLDMNSPRNLFILGIALFTGLCVPPWIKNNNTIHTGSDMVDQILYVMLGTSMFVGGFIGLVLDNIIPGTEEERGLLKWRGEFGDTDNKVDATSDVYSLPKIQKYVNKLKISKYLPFCPNFSRTAWQRAFESLRKKKARPVDV